MEKEYGNLSLEHLKLLMQFADLLDTERKEVSAVLRGNPDKWKTVADNLIPWAPYYDEPMLSQLNGFLLAFGLMHDVRAAAKSDDPHQAIIDSLNRYGNEEEISKERGDAILKCYGLIIGLINSFDSLRIFGKYLNELVVTCPLSPCQSFGRKSGCKVKGFFRCWVALHLLLVADVMRRTWPVAFGGNCCAA